MAAKLGDVPPSTVKSWHANKVIPTWRHATVLAAAKRHGVDICEADLLQIAPDDDALDIRGRAKIEPSQDRAA